MSTDALPKMMDVGDPEVVEIRISWDGKTVWINGEHSCLFRASRIKNLILDDMRDLKNE